MRKHLCGEREDEATVQRGSRPRVLGTCRQMEEALDTDTDTPWPLVRERSTPTERQPLVDDI
jgi:hypothetical protein